MESKYDRDVTIRLRNQLYRSPAEKIMSPGFCNWGTAYALMLERTSEVVIVLTDRALIYGTCYRIERSTAAGISQIGEGKIFALSLALRARRSYRVYTEEGI